MAKTKTSTKSNPPATSPANSTDNPPENSNKSFLSDLRVYRIPIALFAASLFFQLVVLPRTFPPSHYDVLGIPRYSSVEQVKEAFQKLTDKWDADVQVPSTIDFIKVRYAFELLTNQLWKRDYDVYSIDEHYHVLEKLTEKSSTGSISKVDLPILEVTSFDPVDPTLDVVNSENFVSKRKGDKTLLIQVFSLGSHNCANFLNNWKRIVSLLDGVANSAMVELGDGHLTTYLAEKKSGKPFFRDGVPALVAFPPECTNTGCLLRYSGELSVDAVTDWVATTILSLPRILYYSKETLGHNFLAKVKPHKVKVIFFSRTGERATPFIRQAAKNYWTYASFAFVLWKEEESTLWWNTFGVESAPAIVFLKDPDVKPVVYHGSLNSSMLTDLIEKNKHQVLPLLRSVSSKELGCDGRGFSRAGNDTRIWYCVVLAGRQSVELNSMRETMRRVQETLLSDGESDGVGQDPKNSEAALALTLKRLTFTWLDGEAQKRYCFFHIHSENSYETCGPRRDIGDVPQLFIIRYERNGTETVSESDEEPRNLFEALNKIDADPASQLVAKYNGSGEILEIILWISEIIKDGDSRELPAFKTKSPDLVPEDVDPIWSTGSEKIVFTGRKMKQWISGLINTLSNILRDPSIGPILLLGACLSVGHIWVKRSQAPQPTNADSSKKLRAKDKAFPRQKTGPGTGSDKLIPPSMTDIEPKDAVQMEFSDSE